MTRVWLYVIHNESKGKPWYYVGQTERLLRRMEEHSNQTGSNATSMYKYRNLVGLYNIGDARDISISERLIKENELTLQLMKLQDNPYRVRGGSWSNHGITRDFTPPIKKLKDICMPIICYCKLPAKKRFNNYVCALKDAEWIDAETLPLNLNKTCTFNVREIFAKPENEPNFCSLCEIPCGKFSTCFNCKK